MTPDGTHWVGLKRLGRSFRRWWKGRKLDWARPLFVVGAPRSGSTYLTHILNQHPSLFITQESRIMVYVHRMLENGKDPWCALAYRDQTCSLAQESALGLVRDFYSTVSKPGAKRWGDKFPHYVDPKTDPGCADRILSLFPQAQFIHLIRDPRAVVYSLLRKSRSQGMPKTLEESVDVWRRCVETAENLPPSQIHRVFYENLVQTPERELSKLLEFVGEPMADEVLKFIQQQTLNPTNFSQPTSTLLPGQVTSEWEEMSEKQLSTIALQLGGLPEQLGYEL